MKSHRHITNELIDQEEIEMFLHLKAKNERKTDSEMRTFQRYLSSIEKGSIVKVLDLPAAVLDQLLAKFVNLTPCPACSKVYMQSFLSLSFHHLKGNW